MKKDQNLPNKNFHSNNSSGSRFHITQITLDNNHLKIRTIEEDHQIKETHEISHKTDVVDQIVEIVNIEMTIQDQTQTNLKFRLMPVPIQTLQIEIIQIIDLETLHLIEIVSILIVGIISIQMNEVKDIKIIDHAIILTTDHVITDQNITTIKIDPAIIHRREIQVITIDKETTLSH